MEKGLTGDQGVIIPGRNVKHLMLKREVREAVEEGRFSIYSIDDIDDGMEVLMGRPAGGRGPDGTFPEGSINRLVEDRLRALAKGYKAFGRPRPSGGRKKEEAEANNDDNSTERGR